MSDITDRADAAKDKVTGSVKEAAGKATDNEQMEAEGALDKLKGDVKDTVNDLKDKVSDIFHKDDKN